MCKNFARRRLNNRRGIPVCSAKRSGTGALALTSPFQVIKLVLAVLSSRGSVHSWQWVIPSAWCFSTLYRWTYSGRCHFRYSKKWKNAQKQVYYFLWNEKSYERFAGPGVKSFAGYNWLNCSSCMARTNKGEGSGGTLRRDNCQLIGVSLIVIARQAQKFCSDLQSGRCCPAKHGGAYFWAVYGFMKDPIAAPGPYENQEC